MEFLPGAFEREWERRRAALLHDLEMGKGSSSDWEIERRGGSAALGFEQGYSTIFSSGRSVVQRSMSAGTRSAARPMRLRLRGVAKGSQPAVVKLASYGGGARAGSMLHYVSRGGELSVETETGEQIVGKGALVDVRADWEHLFDNRADSRDLAVFHVAIEAGQVGQHDQDEIVHNVLKSGFGDRHFVYAISKAEIGAIKVEGVVVLRDGQGERLTGDARAATIVQERFDLSPTKGAAEATFSFRGYGNGVEYGTARVRDLVDRFDGDVRDERGRSVATAEQAGDLVQKEWRKDLHSRKGRDVMHLVMSARAGTDATAFNEAVRDFLGQQFAGHRYVFALHDPANDPKESVKGGKRPHVHAHAIITMRSDDGYRIETSPEAFRQWRVVMAEKARDHGIDMEMTDRREFASAPAYSHNQVRPVSHVGRTEHEGTSEPAQARYAAKRANTNTFSRSSRSREYVAAAKDAWHELAQADSNDPIATFAASQIERIQIAWEKLNVSHETYAVATINIPNMVMLEKLIESEEGRVREMTRSEFEIYERRVETVLLDVEKSLEPFERNDFDEVAAAAREVVSIRREYLEFSERQLAAEGGKNEKTPSDNERWDQAIAKHGETVVEQGNDVMVEVEAARASMDRAEEAGRDATSAGADLQRELDRAARMAIDGNSWLREVAETDRELRLAIAVAERAPAADRVDAERTGPDDADRSVVVAGHTEGRQSTMPSYEAEPEAPQAANNTASSAEIEAEQLRVLSRDPTPIHEADRDAERQAEPSSLRNEKRALREPHDTERTARSDERNTTRSDPPQQHVPRLKELEREIEQKHERDRDDYER
jgi:hypothetical protein